MSPRVYTTKFDHAEARRRHAAGETIHALAKAYGVRWATVARVVDPSFRERFDGLSRAWIYSGTCPDCGGPATRAGGQSRCIPCNARLMATSVRETTLRCVTCKEWKPDAAFPSNRSRGHRLRRGHHSECRECGTRSKRAWRERNKVPCSHGCGAMVDGKNLRTPEKPPECQSCANARIARERAVA